MEGRNDYDREVFNGDLGTVARIDDDEGAVIGLLPASRTPGLGPVVA
jgi:ATP-dependent exoDNAse (exonuclease V) alpha subunit